MTKELAIKLLRGSVLGTNEQLHEAVFMAIRALKAEPIKHGKWKPFDLTWGRSVYACTNCGEAFEVPTEDGKPIYDYCPNCGARMDEVENEL